MPKQIKKEVEMKERRIIVDDKGTERKVPKPIQVFPDKKKREWKYQEVDEAIIKTRELEARWEIGQKEALWNAQGEYHDLPIMVLLMTDTHYGSIRGNVELINDHLKIVSETPNMFMVHNGDHTDNFNIALGSWATGVYEDPINPQLTARAWASKLMDLDKQSKIGALGFGNHDDWVKSVGAEFYDTFLGQFSCPVLTSGGRIWITANGGAKYEMSMTHKWWGTSKLNPTNACKRRLEHEHPDADIVFLGHTHMSEGLHFERGGKSRIGVIGGTYKDDDRWAAKVGIGGRGGSPGWVVALWREPKQMQLFKDVEMAQQYMNSMIYGLENK